MDSNRQKLIARAEVIRGIREYFTSQGFIETDTPSLVLSPGMETHIRPIQVEGGRSFLPTSPEFAMKRLLARGYHKIFQICKAYRLEPKSTTHNPEFTMLEWYRGNSGYEAIMDDVEEMFVAIAKRVHGSTRFSTEAFGEQDVSRPWPRFTIEECFRKFVGLELTELLEVKSIAQACVEKGFAGKDALAPESVSAPGAWDDFFFRIMMNGVEPALEKLGRPAIVCLYPKSQAALSNLYEDERGHVWAKRFEVYAGGLELGNAFDELVDAAEQRRRFEKDMKLRYEIYGDEFAASPIDEHFLRELSQMPPSGGIAMGVDRIAMYFAGAQSIEEVLWLPSHF